MYGNFRLRNYWNFAKENIFGYDLLHYSYKICNVLIATHKAVLVHLVARG